MDYFVHESSYVDEPCEIGAGTKIWHFSHVMKNCRIGSNCNLGQNVCISPDVVIGNNCKIQNNVSIYTGARAGRRRFLRPLVRVHQREQSALADRAAPSLRAHADPPRSLDRRQRDHRVRHHHRPVCLYRRRRGGGHGRSRLRADAGCSGAPQGLDEPARPPHDKPNEAGSSSARKPSGATRKWSRAYCAAWIGTKMRPLAK